MSDKTYVEFQNVSKTYDGQSLVVDCLDLTIRKGEFLTMLGPSGSGKTTSLMMLAGFEAPSSGTIRVGGESLKSKPPHRRNIGIVFQNYALFPHMTVGENLEYPLRVRKVSPAERRERVSKALSMVQMEAMAGRKPAQLSGGQQQRVALARAIIFEPAVVLMDEPLGALDKNLREHLQLEIKHLHERLGITVVYVTHDQSEALTMSDRVAVFDAGKIEQLANPADLYEKPATPFVASFIGENNRLKGKVTSKSGDMYVLATEIGNVRVQSAMEVALGKEVVVSLRPERVSLVSDDRLANGFEGTVEDVIYFGDHRKIYVRVPPGTSLIAKVQNTEVWSELTPGTVIRLGWGDKDGVLVPA